MVNRSVSLLPTMPWKSDCMLAKVEVGKIVGKLKMLICTSLFLLLSVESYKRERNSEWS